MTKILQIRIYVYTILSTYGYVQYVSDQNGYHTHKRTNCNIMYQHSDVTRLRCTLFNKKNLFWEMTTFPKPGTRQTGLTGRFQKSFDMNNWHLLRKGEKL